MPLEIKVGPAQVALQRGYSIFVTDPDGQVVSPSDKGLYFFDTRLISSYAIYANGAEWDLVNSGATSPNTSRTFLTNCVFQSETGLIAARTLSLVISRALEGGLHETYEITNYGRGTIRFNLEIAIRSDFADIFEVRQDRIVRRGRITSTWSEPGQVLTTSYSNAGFARSIRSAGRTPQPAVYANGRISCGIELGAGQCWTGVVLHELVDGDAVYPAPESFQVSKPVSDYGVLKIATSVHNFQRLFDQAVEDMAALRLPAGGGAFFPAAGLPWFVALFGRDTLIASLQSQILEPNFARGVLDVLGQWQAQERDDYRDAEPGKILHELRRGELAALKLIPHTPYYGTADATPLYLMTLHAAWRATGDLSLLQQHLAVAEGCLTWIDQYGDRDGDGFQEYGTRSGAGYENVGWKDSGEALVTPEGDLVHGPKALCELQGYVYAAWRGMAEAFEALGQPGRAAMLTKKADALFIDFNAVFWDEVGGFYALCLDGDKKPIWTVASNAGHLLWCGIVPPHRAARVVRRFMEPDMWSGWGIRTLTMNNPSYNPYSYQNGSVWPHDNSLIALGFKRYGFHEEANRITEDICRAAGFFTQRQLPELYSGVQRNHANFPVQYLGANVPQAWAAASVFALVQTILGVRLDAPDGLLHVDPVLPAWLPDLILRGLKLGPHSFDLQFRRDENGDTEMTVLAGDPAMVRRGSAPIASF